MSNNNLLIDKFSMQKYVQLTNKNNNALLDQFIRDAQFIDLGNLICEDYLTDLILNKNDYNELIIGSNYVYNGVTYINVGLEIVLTYFAYARYVNRGSYFDTAFGFVEKNNEGSQNVNDKIKREIYIFNRQKAVTYWDNVKRYLERTNFKNWEEKCGKKCVGTTITQPFTSNVIKNNK